MVLSDKIFNANCWKFDKNWRSNCPHDWTSNCHAKKPYPSVLQNVQLEKGLPKNFFIFLISHFTRDCLHRFLETEVFAPFYRTVRVKKLKVLAFLTIFN